MIAHPLWFGPEWGFFLLWPAFWIILIVGSVALIRGRSRAGPPPSPPALHVAEERYARGEITREEFLERRAVLTGSSSRGGQP